MNYDIKTGLENYKELKKICKYAKDFKSLYKQLNGFNLEYDELTGSGLFDCNFNSICATVKTKGFGKSIILDDMFDLYNTEEECFTGHITINTNI